MLTSKKLLTHSIAEIELSIKPALENLSKKKLQKP
jgi:hypothetical protein